MKWAPLLAASFRVSFLFVLMYYVGYTRVRLGTVVDPEGLIWTWPPSSLVIDFGSLNEEINVRCWKTY